MSGKNENWNEIFGDDFSAEDFYLEDADALDVSSLDEVGESAETFPIDAAFFASDEDYQLIRPLGDTSVIPPEVQDLTAYTDGNRSTEDWPEDDFEIDFGDSLDDLDEDEEDETDEERAIQLTRRKRTGLMGGLMYAAFIVGISLILASVAWMIADDVLALTKEEFTVEIVVPENFTIEDVAEELYAQGVIRWRPIFIQFARIYNAEDRIEPGLYQVSPVDYRAIINRLNQRTGQLIETTVLIPEGRNMREIFEILEENGVATAEALEEVVNTVRFDEFEWLAGLPMTTMNRLEGYLFPDTYTFFRHQNPETVIRRMLRNFDFRMRDNDIFELLEESDLTLHEAVNIAAMIEKEIANWDEAPIISSVIHNRLNVPMILQIDATVQYLLPEPRPVLRTEDLQIESPYNTWLVMGLPYGPIGNPGVRSILAAIQPANTNFLFYALHQDGHHEFFPNYEQHNAFVHSPNFAHYDVLFAN